jgi:hypothetical protein
MPIGTVAMKLYYLAGSCALAPHIALEHGIGKTEVDCWIGQR